MANAISYSTVIACFSNLRSERGAEGAAHWLGRMKEAATRDPYAATIKAASRDARREAWEECRDLLRQAADGPGATRQALTGVFTAMAGSLGASARDPAMATAVVELLAHF